MSGTCSNCGEVVPGRSGGSVRVFDVELSFCEDCTKSAQQGARRLVTGVTREALTQKAPGAYDAMQRAWAMYQAASSNSDSKE